MGTPTLLDKIRGWIRQHAAIIAIKWITIPELYWADQNGWETFIHWIDDDDDDIVDVPRSL